MRRAVPLMAVLALVIAGTWSGEETALAAGGDLDPTFGDGGLATGTDFYQGLDGADAAVLQPDGKIVVAGYVLPDPDDGHQEFAVARFGSDGSPDVTFDGDGIASTVFRAGDECYEEATSVVMQGDGKIVVVGESSCRRPAPADETRDAFFALARYEDDGTPDATFGEGGTVLTGFGDPQSCRAQGEAVALDLEGRIVVGGVASCTDTDLDTRFAVARYDTDGELDTSFGDDGRVTTNFTRQFDRLVDVEVQPDGKIVAGGTAAYWIVDIPDALESRAALARYEEDGTLDTTFGGDGKVTTSFRSRRCPGSNESYDLEIQPDGRIVQGGSVACAATVGGIPHPRWALARYRPNGTLDRTFDGDGRVVTVFTETTWGDWMSAIAIQANGRVVAAGSTARHISRFMLVRYRTDGRPDPGFGEDGRVQTIFGTGPGCASGGWGSVAIQPDRKILTTGGGGCEKSFVLARFLPS